MEHLNSRFKLLVDAVNHNHTRAEIRYLALSIVTAVGRLLDEHGHKSPVAKNLRTISVYCRNYIAEIIEKKSVNVSFRDREMGYFRQSLTSQEKRTILRHLNRIQGYIKAVAAELKIELEEVMT
jgi:hypothetical protein|tara:strand:+ start:99 stop:470 length:372 start_codon:yes stop_codon:yes gene_type:complete